MGAHSDKPGPDPQPRERVSLCRVGIRMTNAERDAVFMIASEEETTLSDIVREAIVLYTTFRD